MENGWVVGHGGTILHTGNGAAVSTTEHPFQNSTFNIQIFPNPVSEIVTFEYSLEREEKIEIAVYNLAGQEVGKVFEGIQGRGMRNFTWNAEGLRSGIYFCKLQIGDRSRTRKMIVLH
jgi:hypothetical protein